LLRNKLDLIREIVKETEMPQYEVRNVLTGLDKVLWKLLSSGDDVLLGSIGKFRVTVHEPCKRRNCFTGEFFDVPATRHVRFRLFDPIKNAVKNNRGGINAEGQGSEEKV
jgi:nucleoid DNA-binding protein